MLGGVQAGSFCGPKAKRSLAGKLGSDVMVEVLAVEAAGHDVHGNGWRGS